MTPLGKPQILLQLTDTHIVPEGSLLSGNVDTSAYLRQAVKQIKRLRVRPQAILVTGDLVDDGSFDSYQQFLSVMSEADLPVYALPGNHDNRDNFLKAFPDIAHIRGVRDAPFIQYAVDLGCVRLIALDTTIPGQPHGQLCQARLQWLADALAQEPVKPTIVAMHHPPFLTGMVKMDTMGLNEGRVEFERIIAANPQVQCVVCGHVHRMCMRSFAGAMAIVSPSAAHQLAFQFDHTQPLGYTFEPSGGLLHVWHEQPDVKVVSHLMSLSEYEGPFFWGKSHGE